MAGAATELLRLLSSQFRCRFVLQLEKSDTARTIELTEIPACSSNAHPFLHQVEGYGGGSGLLICRIEGSISSVLMIGDAAFSALRWTGCSNEIAQLLLPFGSGLLSLHT